MYTGFYNLTGRPFQLTPDPRFYFESRTHKKAMAYLTYGLSQYEGFIVITGDIGAGKTTLVGHLFDELDRNKFIAAKVVTTQLDADAILRMVASSFGIKTEGTDKATLLKKIEALMIDQSRRGKRVLLVVDEAQNLSNSALEELRMLSNFQLDQKPLVQCFLLGQPQFRDRLGSDPEFTDDAYKAIHAFTEGVPRKLNTFCSRVLLYGFLEELHKIDAGVVESVIDDLSAEEMANVAAPARPGNGAAPAADFSEVLERLDKLERSVRQHDKTINRAIEIAADWIEGRGGDDGQ